MATDQVKSFDIKIPSLEEQKEILGKIERVESTRTVIKKSATTIDEFFNSLQHKAFSGELSGAA